MEERASVWVRKYPKLAWVKKDTEGEGVASEREGKPHFYYHYEESVGLRKYTWVRKEDT